MSNKKGASFAPKALDPISKYDVEHAQQQNAGLHAARWSDIETAAEYIDDLDSLTGFLHPHRKKAFQNTAQRARVQSILTRAFEKHGLDSGHKEFNYLVKRFNIRSEMPAEPEAAPPPVALMI